MSAEAMLRPRDAFPTPAFLVFCAVLALGGIALLVAILV
jgi:hypothetical protein